MLPDLISHLSPVQGFSQKHEKVCLFSLGKQEPPLRQISIRHPCQRKITTIKSCVKKIRCDKTDFELKSWSGDFLFTI